VHYDVLRALDYLREAGIDDARTAEAKQIVRDKRQADGTWRLEARHSVGLGVVLDEAVGGRSRWITLRALRVLR
jgi:hypothetical protein